MQRNIWVKKDILFQPDFWSKKIGFLKYLGLKDIWSTNFVSKKVQKPLWSLVPKNFGDFRHPCFTPRHPHWTLQSPIRHPPDTFWVSSKHTLDTHQISASLVPLNYDIQLVRGVGGWFLLHNHATSWSNLQYCKISSKADQSGTNAKPPFSYYF